MKEILSFLLVFCGFNSVISQETHQDTISPKQLKEIIVIGKKTQVFEKQTKSLSTVDEYLQKSSRVGMIKRGAYAWEPIINSMPTERTLVTIDGMRIFGACTDKMDPVTSYVEVSNLSEATICSGQEGACFGTTIGGSIDLKRMKNTFRDTTWNFNLNTGFETNNAQKIAGLAIDYADSLFYVATDFMFRDADNYRAGNNKEVQFSQFRKLNLSQTIGYKTSELSFLEASVIYDKATNVGYPALPMDVSLAQALITSLKYEYKPVDNLIKNWETKIYFNTITHKMDDTKRPNVAIHMDMPGWSKTYGYYSKVEAQKGNHHFLVNLNSFLNNSLAEMTMYPNNPNENPMFMLTWPDVDTFYNGIFLEDNYAFNCHSSLRVSASFGVHSNKIKSQFGLESLQIFYPEMKDTRTRFLKNVSTNYTITHGKFQYGVGAGYGERAPSVSEAYGFYLFNSFDGFDQIGNPNLKNEKVFEGNAFVSFKNKKWTLKAETSYFHIMDYIISRPNSSFIPMTIGANGVKVYTALDYATIYNVSLSNDYRINDKINWNMKFIITKGIDSDKMNLPFMSPFSYSTNVSYFDKKITADLTLLGNGIQNDFSPFYGEDKTPDFAVLNANFGYKFKWNRSKLLTKIGVENILDTNYSTYLDWNNLPQKGRNFFVNINYML
ncbi:MAG: TonB-dependent receptor [Bacteroidetes bacterium]|uniref:TonB-dependent receptor n=1 Tax=Flavobacterium sp. TaxID=239 RepID=UPI002FDA9E79|nr:TonB-dependent receptor [Bacteroidota bacterium]